jgi:UDP-2,4-diacetamido-2,4,6-trideoxy-beta-L-altropyranose hydrolase
MPLGTLILRADASVAIGTGHVMRCLAIAQAWQDAGGSCIFAMAQTTPAVEQRLCAEKCLVSTVIATPVSQRDAAQVVELAAVHMANWIVVDGYQFNAAYQRTLKAAGLNVLMMDDGGRGGSYCADFVLDHSPDASEEPYRNREAHTRLLLGTQYIMLRREFMAWRKWKREIPLAAQQLLVTIGGSDPGGLTSKIIAALLQGALTGLATTVIVGGSNPRLTELRRAAAAAPSQINLLYDPPNMPELIARADLAVICAGGTLWELLYMGCASLSYARDKVQGQIIARLQSMGAVLDLGSDEKFDDSKLIGVITEVAASQTRRAEMARIGREIVDGEGPPRVRQELLGGSE